MFLYDLVWKCFSHYCFLKLFFSHRWNFWYLKLFSRYFVEIASFFIWQLKPMLDFVVSFLFLSNLKISSNLKRVCLSTDICMSGYAILSLSSVVFSDYWITIASLFSGERDSIFRVFSTEIQSHSSEQVMFRSPCLLFLFLHVGSKKKLKDIFLYGFNDFFEILLKLVSWKTSLLELCRMLTAIF